MPTITRNSHTNQRVYARVARAELSQRDRSKDSQPSMQPYTICSTLVAAFFRVKLPDHASAHYHVLAQDSAFQPGRAMTITITPDTDLPDDEWAWAVFDHSFGLLSPIIPWHSGARIQTESVSTSIYSNPVVIVAGFYLSSAANSVNGEINAAVAHYELALSSS